MQSLLFPRLYPEQMSLGILVVADANIPYLSMRFVFCVHIYAIIPI